MSGEMLIVGGLLLGALITFVAVPSQGSEPPPVSPAAVTAPEHTGR